MIYRALAEKHDWGPEIVGRLTLDQMLMYLEDPANLSDTIHVDSVGEALKHVSPEMRAKIAKFQTRGVSDG